jgi:aspartyl/asparaginyl-tRNA synthetase
LDREEKERQKAEKKAKKAAQQAAEAAALAIPEVTYLSVDEEDSYAQMGDMKRVMSRSETGRKFVRVQNLGTEIGSGSTVWLRGRLDSIRVKGGSCFLVLRQDSFHTVQACFFKDKENPEFSQKMIRYLKGLTIESMIDLKGTLTEAEVRSCSIQNVELKIERIHSVSNAAAQLPFLVEDAIMRIQSAICQLFHESLYSQGFVEIHTPKLIAGESESGAGVFTTDYFGTTACLAQSPPAVQTNGYFI